MPLFWLLTAMCVSNAIQAQSGYFSEPAVRWLVLACAFGLAAIFAPAHCWRGRRAEGALFAVLGVALLWHLYQIANRAWPVAYFQERPPLELDLAILAGLFLASVLALLGFWRSGHLSRFHRIRFLGLLLVHFVVGIVVIKIAPEPPIDVWFIQQDGSRALLHGVNPYGINIPDIYPAGHYGPEVQHDGRIWIGYCYLPGSLLMVVPSVALLGDCRFSQLIAMSLSALLMAFARPSRVSFAAAGVFLFTPRLFYVLGLSWTDPFALVALCLVVFCACRAPRHLTKSFALLLTTKQYVIFIVPLLWLLRSRLSLRQIASAFAMAAVVIVPFVLWDFGAFWRNSIAIGRWFQWRNDSLSLPNWLHLHGHSAPGWLAFFMLGAILLCLRVRWISLNDDDALTPSLFAAGSALVWLAFFCFSREAFCNYYFLIIGALFLAVAAWPQSAPCGQEEILRATTSSDDPIGK